MKDLVANGASVNTKVCGCTALMYAVFYGKQEMVEYLITAGADINVQNLSKLTPLMWAVEREQLAIVEILISKGAKVKFL
jgi:ankyrin repeat protein